MQRERSYEFTSSYEHSCGSFARKFLRPRNLESVQFSRVILKYIRLCRPLSRAVFTRFRSHSAVSECSVLTEREKKKPNISLNLCSIFTEELKFNFSIKLYFTEKLNSKASHRAMLCEIKHVNYNMHASNRENINKIKFSFSRSQFKYSQVYISVSQIWNL